MHRLQALCPKEDERYAVQPGAVSPLFQQQKRLI